MVEVNFYDSIDNEKLRFAVIIAKHNGNFVLCKHRERTTLEIPGGHREKNEPIDFTARRELFEETGAIDYSIRPVCIYSVKGNTRINEQLGEETFGMLFYAEIRGFKDKLDFEIERLVCTPDLSAVNWTYPEIQPKLLKKAMELNII